MIIVKKAYAAPTACNNSTKIIAARAWHTRLTESIVASNTPNLTIIKRKAK